MIKTIFTIVLFLFLTINVTFAQLWDNYDGSGGLSYTSEDVTYWNVSSGVYEAQTGGVSTPEHSFSSYDITSSIAGWNLSNSNNNEWIGWFDLNRSSVSGWGGSSYSCGMVLAADNSDFNSNTTMGYALGFTNTSDVLVLFKFSAGITDGTTELPGTSEQIISSGYVYSDGDNGVNFYVKLESDGKWTLKYKAGTQLSDGSAINPASYTDGSVTTTVADETYRGTGFKYAGWIYAHYTSGTSKAFFDNFGFAQNGSLPVELSSFSASGTHDGVELIWKTETEVNNYGFEMQRKTAEVKSQQSDWEKIGFVEGHGNSNSVKYYKYIDRNISAGKYSYRLKQIDNDGSFEYSKTIDVEIDVVRGYELSQNYPNPFNPATTIKFSIPENGFVSMDLYNVLGEKVRNIINEMRTAGVYTLNLDLKNLNSGVYLYKIDVNNYSRVMKMNLMK